MDFKPVLAWHINLNRGDRAELRRAHTPLELAVASGFHGLRNMLPGTDPQRVSQIARVLSFVDSHENKSFGKALKPVMSESRLRRLVECDREEISAHLIEAIRLLKGRANVVELAEIIYWWGERRAQHLAYEYFGAIEDSDDEVA